MKAATVVWLWLCLPLIAGLAQENAPIPTLAAPPDAKLILAGPPDATGKSLVQGFAGAVPGSSRVMITNTVSSVTVSTTAGSDGSFQAAVPAAVGQTLSLRYTLGSETSESMALLTFAPAITGVMPALGGTINDLALVGSYGYVADTVGLKIVNLANTSNPQVVGTLMTTTKAAGVAVNGQYAYVAAAFNNHALYVVDVSNKTNPRTVSSLFPASGGSCVAVSVSGGKTLVLIGGYFAGKGTGLQVVDATDPLAPVALSFVKLSSTPQALVVAERYAYAAIGALGVQTLDLANPSAPFVLTSFSSVGNASRLAFLQTSAGNTLAIPGSAGLRLVNVNNAAAPLLIATALPGTTTYDAVAAGGGMMAVAAGWPSYGLVIVDVSVPTSSLVVGSWRTDGAGSRMCLGAGLALMSTVNTSAGLNVVDLQLPQQPALLSAIPLTSTTVAIALSGSSALTAANNYNSSLANRHTLIWTDQRNPRQPEVTGTLTQSGVVSAAAWAESGPWALVGGSNGTELQVIEAASQTVIGRVRLPFGAIANTIRARGHLAYIAGGVAGLLIVDLGLDGRAPIIVGSVDTPGLARGVEVAGEYAYVADDMKGVQVVDIANPLAPKLVGAGIPTAGAAQSVRVEGQYLYLAQAAFGGNNGLAIFDLANPAAPVSMAKVATTGYARQLDVAGGLAYLASDNAGLVIVDISNPSLPRVARMLKTFGYCRDVKASGGLVYLADDAAVQAVVAISPTP
jgi:hypothetical protein